MTIENVLDELGKVFHYRLELELLPETFKTRFYDAAERLSGKRIPREKMGIAEECADLAYQVMKVMVVQNGILTLEKQKVLYNEIADSIERMTISQIYGRAHRLVREKDVDDLYSALPREAFLNHRWNTSKEFLANQLVSYISRRFRVPNNTSWAYHTVDFIKETKIPEETAELIEVLNRYPEGVYGNPMLDLVCKRALDSHRLSDLVKEFVGNSSVSKKLLLELELIFIRSLNPNIYLEDAVNLCLFKIRGRQELTFKGYTPREVMHICKPAEYLLEANLIL